MDSDENAQDHLDNFEAFYRADHLSLLKLLMKLGADRHDAWDIAQESYIRALANWGQIHSNPRQWVRVTAVRQLRGQRKSMQAPVSNAYAMGWTTLPHIDKLDLPEESRRVMRAITALPRRQSEVMALTVDGYKPREIAEILAAIYPKDQPVSANAVSASLAEARRRLKAELSREPEDRS